MTESGPRTLIIAHGHPDFSPGGAEISAHCQWSEMRRRGIEAMLLARVAETAGHTGTPFIGRSSDGLEVLLSFPPVDHFRHSQPHRRVVCEDFRALLETFRPSVIHFHHYAHLGLELIREVRKYSPGAAIVVTLHEYLAICHAQGQMLKTSGLLCHKAAPVDCHMCFPHISPQDFFLRELFVKSFFRLVDRFVSPSEFLRDRYVAWGLPAASMAVIENGQPPRKAAVAAAPRPEGYSNRFAVLGQLSRLKGTLVLFDAVRLLPKSLRKRINIEIHGSVLYADDDFRNQLAESLKELKDTVRLCGPYVSSDVQDIVSRNGWLIVPSIWWENSPLVIQEAFAAGRPVICSNIGGMAEKVHHGVSGLHFRVNSPADLAARIEECATTPGLWETLCAGVPRPPAIEETVDQLLALYDSVLTERTARELSVPASSEL